MGNSRKNQDLEEKAPTERSVVAFDPLRAYLTEIRRFPFLSREEEYQLAVRYIEKGDLDAVAQLVMANLQFVVNIAREYKRVSIPLLDIIQEGNIGLMHAVKRFDPYRGTRLSTYATWWIRAFILRYIMKNWRLVKIGTTEEERRLFFQLRKEKELLEAQGQESGPRLLASRLKVDEMKLIEMEQRLADPELSLSEPHGESETGLEAILPASIKGADEEIEEKELKDLLTQKIEQYKKKLKDRDCEILEKRILSETPETLQHLADRFHISKERVRQLESNISKRLKSFLKKEFHQQEEK
ncbi:MAG TPA: RNA polymerase factor sigma-32 [Nitrospiria bacterium]|jgi:RNA polymerase sigma-32 factor